MNPRETMYEEMTDEFAADQATPLECSPFPTASSNESTSCRQYIAKFKPLYDRFKASQVALHTQPSAISSADLAQCYMEIPEKFFHSNFYLFTPQNFAEYIMHAGSSFKQQQLILTNYLDVIEVTRLKLIISRSPAFFSTIDDINQLKRLVQHTLQTVKSLKKNVNSLSYHLTSGSMYITKLQQRRNNSLLLHNVLATVQYILQNYRLLQQLIIVDDILSAITALQVVQDAYTPELHNVVALNFLSEKLNYYSNYIRSNLSEKFLHYAANVSIEEEDGEALVLLLQALYVMQTLHSVYEQYQAKLKDNVKLIIRTCLLEYQITNYIDDSAAPSDSVPFAQKIKNMSDENFLSCLLLCYESLTTVIVQCHYVCLSAIEFVNEKNAAELPHAEGLGTSTAKIVTASRNCFIKCVELSQTVISDLLTFRSDTNHNFNVEQMQFLWEISFNYVSSFEKLALSSKFNMTGYIIKQAILRVTENWLENFHELDKTKLSNVLASEKWVQTSISPETQIMVNKLTCHNSEPSKEEKAPLVIDDQEFKVVYGLVVVIEIVVKYLNILKNYPSISQEVISKIVKIIELFDSKTKKLVLGAEAVKAGILRSIAAKNLAITSQCFSCLLVLLPYIKATFMQNSVIQQSVEFDKLSQMLQAHQNMIFDKFVDIVSNFLDASSLKLKSIDWDRFSGHAEYFEEVNKNITALHRVLLSHLPPTQLQYVFNCIFSVLNRKIVDHFEEIHPSTQTGRQRIVDEIIHLTTSFSRLKLINSHNLNIEENMRRKYFK